MLPDTLPVINRIVPPAPAVMVGGPVINTLPPVVIPVAALIPALSHTAVAVALVVLMFWFNAKSPDIVSTNTVPVLVRPETLPTVSTANAPALVYDTLPSLVVASPPAKVPTLLLVLFNVNEPVPCSPKPDAVMAAVCVTAPVAYKSTVLLVAVSAPLTAKAPP